LMNKAMGALRKASTSAGKDPLTMPRFVSAWQDRGYALEVGRRSRQLRCDVVHVMNYSQFAQSLSGMVEPPRLQAKKRL
jgi:hypothetical protein